jgi:formamidopyrimidine-DNA glycosylase
MPELPEVETTLKGITKGILNKKIQSFVCRDKKLRWPIPSDMGSFLKNQSFESAQRRGKYIILNLSNNKGSVLIHLGMSGKLRISKNLKSPVKHEHWDINFIDGWSLRYTDIRKFGAMLKTKKDPNKHKLIKILGPEPLGNKFNGEYLFKKSRKKSLPIKNFIMDSKIVVGVGNIYANEALFMAGIRPTKKSGSISKIKFEELSKSIVLTLREAIEAGGTTLKDYTNAEEAPGYFKKELKVYDRGGENCFKCSKKLKEIRQANRQTVYCSNCQN